MREVVERSITKLLRVPPEPEPPEGSPGSLMVFRAGRNYYRWRLAIWVLTNIGVLAGFAVGYYTMRGVARQFPGWAQTAFHIVEALGLAGFFATLPLTWLEQRLNFRLRWYMVTDRSLRIRSGIWTVQEITMTFANIQEIRVTSGPLQHFLKLADVEVRSAGGGIGKNGQFEGHAAYFEGVDNAETIRDFIVERLRKYRDSGLGDSTSPEHHLQSTLPLSAEDAAAARELLAEVRAVRSVLENSAGVL